MGGGSGRVGEGKLYVPPSAFRLISLTTIYIFSRKLKVVVQNRAFGSSNKIVNLPKKILTTTDDYTNCKLHIFNSS